MIVLGVCCRGILAAYWWEHHGDMVLQPHNPRMESGIVLYLCFDVLCCPTKIPERLINCDAIALNDMLFPRQMDAAYG
jgi:hypothetical protein